MQPPAPGTVSFHPSGSFLFGTAPAPAHYATHHETLPPAFQGEVGELALAEDPAWAGATLQSTQADVIVQDWQGYTGNLLSMRICVWEDRLRAAHGMPADCGTAKGDTHALLLWNLDGATAPSDAGPALVIDGQSHAALNFTIPAEGLTFFFPTWMNQIAPGGGLPWASPRVGNTALCQAASGSDHIFGAPLPSGFQVYLQPIVFVPGDSGHYCYAAKPTQVTF